MLSSRREEADLEKKADSASMGRAESILDLNGLKYRIPQKLSSAVSRNYRKEYSIKGSHGPSDVITFDLNTGASYVSPDSAYLSFKFNIETTDPANVAGAQYTWSGSMGAAALISEIRIVSKNGVECDRVQDAGLLATIWAKYNLSSDSSSMVDMAQGYGPNSYPIVANGATTFTNDLDVCIPLKYICGFFRPTVEGMLIPAGLASGLRVEISLTNQLQVPMQGLTNAKPIVSYTVTQAELLLQQTQLNDPTASSLMSESAANGLEYTFPSYYSTKLNYDAATTFSTQINKAVSQGIRAFVAFQDPLAAPAVEILRNSMASQDAANLTAYQFRVGNAYMPQVVITRQTQKLAFAQDAMLGLHKVEYHPNQVDFDGFMTGGEAIAATSLETNDRLNLSGLMLNNSSVLALEATLGPDPARGTLFLEFVAVARTSLNRTQLKI
jgi:hypothetical protein